MDRSINELMLTRQAHLDAVKELDIEIIQQTESQRRELDRILNDIGGRRDQRGTRRKRTPEQIERASAAMKAAWARRRGDSAAA